MKVLGVRCSTREIRYAILEKQGDNIVFINKDLENRLIFPVNIQEIEKKLKWCKEEIKRILRQNGDISCVVIKVNEFSRGENLSKREGTYIDGVVMLTIHEHNIAVSKKLYNQIGANGSNILNLAENIDGRTDKYWNKGMADAIQCAAFTLRGMN
jgi:Holliday junction resolvasome RuvABC endonuclease subunit